jgi:hypothetical protein
LAQGRSRSRCSVCARAVRVSFAATAQVGGSCAAWSRDSGECFTSGDVGAVEVGRQWVEPECFRRVLLVTVRDGGVDVDDQPGGEVGSCSGGPGLFPGRGANGVEACEVGVVDAVQHSPGGGVTTKDPDQ